MKKFLKNLLLSTAVLSISALIFTACGTTSGTDNDKQTEVIDVPEDETNAVDEKKNQEKEVIEEAMDESEDPVNVVFAKNLQKELRTGNVKKAIELFEAIPEELNGDEDMEMLRASLYVSDGNYAAALDIANNLLNTNPDNTEALELVALLSRASGDNNTYKATAKKILQKDPFNPSVNIMQGEDYALNHKYKLAKESYNKALKSEPDNSDALYGYAQMSYYLNDLKSAKDTTQRILEKEPENSAALAFMGKLAAEDSNYVRAVKYTKDAIKYEPNNYLYYLDLGNYYVQQGKNTDAIAAWDKAIDIDPEYFLAYAYRAGCYDEMGKYEEALENYRMVIKTNPKYYYAYESTGMLAYHFGNYDEAREYFDQAYNYSKYFGYKLLNAASYFKAGDSFHGKQVITSLLKTLDRNSVEYDLVRMYGDTYSRNAAANLLSKIAKLDNSTKKGRMWFYLGLYYEVNGSMESATEYYSKVTKMQAPMFFEYRLAEWSLGL